MNGKTKRPLPAKASDSKRAKGALAACFWLAAWEAAALIVGRPLLLPGPIDTLRALAALGRTAAFWRSTGMTLLRILTGYGAAVLLGVLLAAVCVRVRAVDTLLSPLRSVIRATPVSSFIMLVLIWIRRDGVPVFISFLRVLPIVWTGVEEALLSVDAQLVEMTRAYRLTAWKKIRFLYAPAVRPAFLAACTTGLGFAWKSGIAAEVIALPAQSVGKNLYDAKIYLERADLFAWTLTVIVLSMLLEALLRRVVRERRVSA